MKSGAKILQKVRRGARQVAYGNALYQKMLESGAAPGRFHFTPPDLWPGDARAGLALIGSQQSLFEQAKPQCPATALRNLRAVGTDAARLTCINLIESWMRRHGQWDDAEWAPDVLGNRVAAWIGFYEFYASTAGTDFIAALTASLQKQYKHLARTLTSTLAGVAGLSAIKGLVFGGLNFEDGEKSLGLAYELLQRQLTAEILPDGGVITRNPSDQLHVLRHLIDLRNAFKAAALELPEILGSTIHAMIPGLKLLRHGDGGLALFNGSTQETPFLIDAVILQASTKSRILRRLPNMGYERLGAGRSLLIADCAAPPPSGYDEAAHAGLLSFEFSHGRERLIVNCGTFAGALGDWRAACAATAAHSTLTLEETNACEIEADGVKNRAHITAQRFEQDGTQCLELTHDAYRAKFGITHQRFLSLLPDGEELRGRETLTGGPGRAFTLRWHLHPSVQASLTQGGQTALLRTPLGGGWRLRMGNNDPEAALALDLESSIFCGTGAPRRNLQLKVSGHTQGTATDIAWSLVREKKA